MAGDYRVGAGGLWAKRVAPQCGVPTRGSGAQGRMPLAPGSRAGHACAAVVAPWVATAAAAAAAPARASARRGPAAVPTAAHLAVPGAVARVAGEPRAEGHVSTVVVRAHAA